MFMKFKMPKQQNVSPNMILLNKILENQEMIISKMKHIENTLSKVELTTNNLISKHTLTTQRVSSIETKIDKILEPKTWW